MLSILFVLLTNCGSRPVDLPEPGCRYICVCGTDSRGQEYCGWSLICKDLVGHNNG